LQWPACFSRWREGKEGGREKLLVGASPRTADKYASHHHDGGGEVHRMPPRMVAFGSVWAPHVPPKACDGASSFLNLKLIYIY